MLVGGLDGVPDGCCDLVGVNEGTLEGLSEGRALGLSEGI